jgi:hypothetical protein
MGSRLVTDIIKLGYHTFKAFQSHFPLFVPSTYMTSERLTDRTVPNAVIHYGILGHNRRTTYNLQHNGARMWLGVDSREL